MTRFMLALILALSVVPASAGKLDLDDDRYEPLPAIAAADSAILPGAGWFYTSHHGGGPGDFFTGAGFLLATVGGVVLASKLFRDKNPMFGGGIVIGVIGLRFSDIHGASRRAVNLNLSRRAAQRDIEEVRP